MKISILHPSYKRPYLAMDCYTRWVGSLCRTDNVEYILSLSANDPTMSQYMEIFKDKPLVKIVIHPENSWVIQLNNAAKQCTGDLFVCIGDDFSCPINWDTEIISMLWDKNDYIVKTQDGTQPWIMTLPMMDRTYYNRFRYVIYPEYRHMWGDTELTHVADMIGKVINLDLLFPHEHYTTGKNKRDDVNIANDSTWNQGETLYITRMKNNFDLVDPLPVTLPDHHTKYLKAKGVKI